MSHSYQEVELTTPKGSGQSAVKVEDSVFQEKVPNDPESIQNLINAAEAILRDFDWWGSKYHSFLIYLNSLNKEDSNLSTDLKRLINILKLNSCLESIFFLDDKHRIDSKFREAFSYFPSNNPQLSLSSVLNQFIKVAIFNKNNSPTIDYDAIEQTLYWDIFLKKSLLVGMLAMITLAAVCGLVSLSHAAGPIVAAIVTLMYSLALFIGVINAEKTFKEWDNQLENIQDLVGSITDKHQAPSSHTVSI
jgi:hypothetical protein